VAEENYKNISSMNLASRRSIGVATSSKQAKNWTACNNLLRHSIRNCEESLLHCRLYSMLHLECRPNVEHTGLQKLTSWYLLPRCNNYTIMIVCKKKLGTGNLVIKFIYIFIKEKSPVGQ
jgi:hypothetical protein